MTTKVFSTYYSVKGLGEEKKNQGELELEKYLWIVAPPFTEKKYVFIAESDKA